MTPTTAFLTTVAAAIAADTAGLAEVAKVLVLLVKAPFVPGLGIGIGDLTEADFNTYAAKAVATAAAQVFTDPATGELIIQLDEPASGWHWQTGTTANLPQTIYGYAVTDSTKADVWGTALLPAPVLLNGAGQGVDIGQVRFRLSNGALS